MLTYPTYLPMFVGSRLSFSPQRGLLQSASCKPQIPSPSPRGQVSTKTSGRQPCHGMWCLTEGPGSGCRAQGLERSEGGMVKARVPRVTKKLVRTCGLTCLKQMAMLQLIYGSLQNLLGIRGMLFQAFQAYFTLVAALLRILRSNARPPRQAPPTRPLLPPLPQPRPQRTWRRRRPRRLGPARQ